MIRQSIKNQRVYFHKGLTKPIETRITQLKKLKSVIKKYENDILKALKQDLNKPVFEAYTNEVGFTLDSIGYTIKHLKKWSKKKRVKTPIHQFGSKSYIESEPYGSVLIIAPFNYPFQLLIEPLIGAIAAGNTVILKPSEHTVETEKLMVKMIKEIFDPKFVDIFTGGKDVTTELINSAFDYIFFTGSVPVGRIVMRAAAENLIPVTLELGGKSPTIVDESANIELAAKRIAWGKFINAGQTCIAPDYVYVHVSVAEALKEALAKNIRAFYGVKAYESVDYGRIVSDTHYQRLVKLIDAQKVFYGGGYKQEERYIEPTILHNVDWSDSVMSEEIFGPILPVLVYEEIDEVIKTIINRPKPLALYLFTESRVIRDEVLSRTSFGGGAINDTISHVATPYLPFGGVGASGMGVYHGRHSFETFSHKRSVIKKSTKLDIKLVFPPYGDKVKLARRFMK